MTTSEQSHFPYTSEEDLCTTIFKERNRHKGWDIGLWKTNIALLFGLAITLALVSSLNISNNYETGNNSSYCSSTRETANLDFAAATGNLISHQCQKQGCHLSSTLKKNSSTFLHFWKVEDKLEEVEEKLEEVEENWRNIGVFSELLTRL